MVDKIFAIYIQIVFTDFLIKNSEVLAVFFVAH